MATTPPSWSRISHVLNPIVLPNRFATASHRTLVCILALLTHDICKSVVTPPPFSEFSSSTNKAHVVKTSTKVAMHPPCNVPNRLHKLSCTYKSHRMPRSPFSVFTEVRFLQCIRGSLSNVWFDGEVTISKNFNARWIPLNEEEDEDEGMCVCAFLLYLTTFFFLLLLLLECRLSCLLCEKFEEEFLFLPFFFTPQRRRAAYFHTITFFYIRIGRRAEERERARVCRVCPLSPCVFKRRRRTEGEFLLSRKKKDESRFF